MPVDNLYLREEPAKKSGTLVRRNREELRSLTMNTLRRKGELSMNELAREMGYSKLTNTLREIIHDMIKAGEVRYLYPDKPQSRNQKICLHNKSFQFHVNRITT